jgi:hypothetical protein
MSRRLPRVAFRLRQRPQPRRSPPRNSRKVDYKDGLLCSEGKIDEQHLLIMAHFFR